MQFDLTERRDDEAIRMMIGSPSQHFTSIPTDDQGGARFETILLQ
jgi:hypothetical protein